MSGNQTLAPPQVGEITRIAPSFPPVGEELNYVVPDGVSNGDFPLIQRLLSIKYTFVTDATVADRVPGIRIIEGTGLETSMVAFSDSANPQTANQSITYYFGLNAPAIESVIAASHRMIWMPPIWMLPGEILNTQILFPAGIQPGDAITRIRIKLQSWRSPV